MIPILVGLLIGFLMCIPIGPINIWVINTYLHYSQRKALAIALGGSVMDFIYFFIILSGLSFVSFSSQFVLGFKALGIFLIIVLGIKELMAKKVSSEDMEVKPEKEDLKSRLMKGVFSFFILGVVLYTANPTLIVTMTGLGAFVKSLELFSFNQLNIFLVSLGLALGSYIWFVFLLFIVKKFEEVIRNKYLHKFTQICGVLMLVLGLYMGGRLIWS